MRDALPGLDFGIRLRVRRSFGGGIGLDVEDRLGGLIGHGAATLSVELSDIGVRRGI